MEYRFLFGPSGSGKTTEALREMAERSIRETEKRFFVIVPEQYGVLMQRKLLELHPRHASGNIEVMSFNRLAWRVFSELNIRKPEILDDCGKAMVLRRAAGERAPRLVVWKGKLKKAGFTEQVKSMVSECLQYGVTPEALRRAAEEPVGLPLSQKLRDLAELLEAFQDAVAGKSIPKEEILGAFADCAERSALLSGAVVLFDGFTGFTPIQYRVIERMMTVCESLTFTVTIGRDADPYRKCAESDLFRMSAEYTAKITDLASKNGLRHAKDCCFSDTPRFSRSPELRFFEQHFLRYDGAQYPGAQEAQPQHPGAQKARAQSAEAQEAKPQERAGRCPDAVRVLCAANPAEEAECAAEEILYLVKKRHYRWREIAVITSDFEKEAALIRREFSAQGIPSYADRTLSVSANPLPELLRAAMRCVTDRFSGESFLRFLKCGLVTDERDLIFLCASYMRLAGVRSFSRLSAEWEYVPRELTGMDLPRLNAFKNEMLSLLLPLRELFSSGKASVGDTARCLRELIEKTGAAGKISAMQGRFETARDEEHVREFAGVTEGTLRVLGEMEDLLGEEILKREDMSGILDAGLSEIRVGQIPAFADRVSIGDLTRTRLGEIRALFLLGANDGALPLFKGEGGLLTDREKEKLKKAGITLAPTAREDLCTQRFYLYRVLTQPAERLYLSTAAQDRGGKAQRPSGILRHVLRLFPGLKAEKAVPERSVLSEAAAERLLIRAARSCRAGDRSSRKILETLLPAAGIESRRRQKVEKLLDAAMFFYGGTEIGPDAAEKLYGNSIEGSVTRLEEYASCPYRHFLDYGLGLKELREFEIGGQDIGTLVHRSIETVFRLAAGKNLQIQAMADEERDRFVDHCTMEAVEGDPSGLYTDSARNRWLIQKISAIVRISVLIMARQLKEGEYVPAAEELSFGPADASSMRILLPGGGEMRLFGKTDRVDLFEDSSRILVKIVDYKTGSTVWEPYRILSGTQIQLILYLDAVTEILRRRHPGKKIVPGAVLYEPVQAPFLKRSEAPDPESALKAMMKKLLPSGLLNAEEDAFPHLVRDPSMAPYLFGVRIPKGGSLPAGDQAVSASRFEKLRLYVREKAVQAGAGILSGRTDASPLREGDSAVCEYCSYRAVCGFDRRCGGYQYQNMEKLDPAEVWKQMDSEKDGREAGQ